MAFAVVFAKLVGLNPEAIFLSVNPNFYPSPETNAFLDKLVLI